MKKYILLALSIIGLFACKEDVEITKATVSDVLTGGGTKSWKLDSITYRYTNPALGAEEDVTGLFLETFEADNILAFSKDGLIFEELEGPTKGSPDDLDVYSSGEFTLNIPGTSLDFAPTSRSYSVYYSIFNLLSSSADLEVLESSRVVYSFNGAPFAGFFGGTGQVVYYLSPVSTN